MTPRLLIVEDERMVALDLHNTLESAGFTVAGVLHRGDEVLSFVQQQPVDLIIMDIRLDGGVDGIEAARALLPLRIPVIFLTAYVSPETLRRAAETLPYGYLVKPFRPQDLFSTVHIALARKMADDRLVAERDHYSVLAVTDALTGLPSRQGLHAELGAEPVPERCLSDGMAVLYIDLDGFKLVNDRLGHAAGDALLQHVVVRMRGVLRDGDLLARVGGDEFVVVTFGVRTPIAALGIANKLIMSLQPPFVLSGGVASVGASVGIAIAPLHGMETEQLMGAADRALYEAKRRGKGRAVVAALSADNTLS